MGKLLLTMTMEKRKKKELHQSGLLVRKPMA